MKTILKKASAAVMALAVMASAAVFDVPGKMTAKAASAEGDCDNDHSVSIPWTNDDNMPEGFYHLEQDKSLGREVEITGDVTLCLNGKTIIAVDSHRAFIVRDGGTLTICDHTGEGKIIGGAISENSNNNNGGVVSVQQDGELRLSGGTITGGLAHNGGGVYVTDQGKFKMRGGVISGNTAAQEGGGVYVERKGEDKGVFEMTGGTISGNTVNYTGASNNGAGGVYTAGKFTMSGNSEISGNTAGSVSDGNYSFGGGVCVSVGGEFTMRSGTIKGNKALYGGGVYVSGGTFEMTGGTIGGANEATDGGGGVCLGRGNSTEFKMSGGTVTGNESKRGGGVNVVDGTFEMTGGKIDTNTASDGGGAYVGGGKFIMSNDGTISDNTAKNGGGAYVGTGTFEMSGGKIDANDASNGGGGVFLYGGEFAMSGGAISKNTADGYGLGVYVDNPAKNGGGGTITLSETVDISSPKKPDGSGSNVFLTIGKKITIGKNFSAVGEIGIHPQEGISCTEHVDVTVFDRGVTAKDISQNFKPDLAGQEIDYDNNMVQLKVVHDYGEDWLTDETYHWYKCGKCGDIKDKATHNWDNGTVTKEPTCTKPGETDYICSDCKRTYTGDEPNATGHNYNITWERTADEHWRICVKNDAETDRAAHRWDNGTVTKEPTYTEPGEITYLCIDCEWEKTEEIPIRIEPLPDDPGEPDEPRVPDKPAEPNAPDTPDSSTPDDDSSSATDDNSSDSNSSTESSNSTDNNVDHGNASPNPSTGLAISLVPLAAAAIAITVTIKRKKK